MVKYLAALHTCDAASFEAVCHPECRLLDSAGKSVSVVRSKHTLVRQLGLAADGEPKSVRVGGCKHTKLAHL